jgi:hypothetical protein
MKELAIGVAALFVLIGLGWILVENDLLLQGYFNPKYEQVRRETFEQSKAYNEGVAQEIRRYQIEYIRATPEQKVAIKSVVQNQFAGYDTSKLPPDCAQFLNSL